MTYFDTTFQQQSAFTAWAWITFHNITDVGNFIALNIAIPVHTGHVKIVFVCTTNKISQMSSATINNHTTLQILRADRTGITTGNGTDLFFTGKRQWRSNTSNFFCFDFVQLMVATQYQRDDTSFTLFVFFTFDQQCFNRLLFSHFQVSRYFSDSMCIWCGDFGCRFGWYRTFTGRCQRFRHFNVSGVIRFGRESNQVFTAVGQNVEFM